jgi:hypothetical protein
MRPLDCSLHLHRRRLGCGFFPKQYELGTFLFVKIRISATVGPVGSLPCVRQGRGRESRGGGGARKSLDEVKGHLDLS